MKKILVVLIVFLALIGVAYAAPTITFNMPNQNGMYYGFEFDEINISTDVFTNCTYNISDGVTSLVNNLPPLNNTNHNISDVNITSLLDGNITLSVFCVEWNDTTNNATSQQWHTKNTTPPHINWVTPMQGGNPPIATTINITVNITDQIGIDDEESNFSVSCTGNSNGTLNFATYHVNNNNPGYTIMSINWTTPANPAFCNITANVTNYGDVQNISTINVSVSYPCGMQVNGDLTLTDDVGACGITALQVNTDNITIDCNGYSIIGMNNTNTTGINISTFNNITITNCEIYNFTIGIMNDGNISNISGNYIHDNHESGIDMAYGSGTYIEWNNISNNGAGIALWDINVTIGSNITRNNITNNNIGVEVGNISNVPGMPPPFMSLFYNDIYSNNLNLYIENSSNANGFSVSLMNMPTGDEWGNFWGHTDHCPYFRSTDTNPQNEMEDYGAYNQSTLAFVGLIDAPQCIGCNEQIDSHVNLTGNVYNSSGGTKCEDGLYFTNDNIILDCKGFTITGMNASDSWGIKANYSNIIIQNCNVNNFTYGIMLSGENNTISNNYLYDNFESGIEVNDSGHIIEWNNISNNGIGIALWDINVTYNTSVYSNNITGNTRGIEVSNVTNIPGAFVMLWNNDVYTNTLDLWFNTTTQTYGFSAFYMNMSSFENYGNFWGHTNHCPYFRTSNTNSMDTSQYDDSAYSSSAINNAGFIAAPDCTVCGDMIQWDENLTDNVYAWDGSSQCTNGIFLNSDNIVFDCKNYNITGDGTGVGINFTNSTNVTVQNCNVFNFSVGMLINGSNHTVEYNYIYNNTNCVEFENDIGGLYFNGNNVTNCTDCLVLADVSLSQDGTIANNTIMYCTNGLYVDNVIGTGTLYAWYNDLDVNVYNLNATAPYTAFQPYYCNAGTCYGNYWGVTNHCPYFRPYMTNAAGTSGLWDKYGYGNFVANTPLTAPPECIVCSDGNTPRANFIYNSTNLTGNVYNWTGGTVCSVQSPGITIKADNVILDCKGYSLYGDNSTQNYAGIQIDNDLENVTIQNCNVQDYSANWASGIYIGNGSGHTIQYNNITNCYYGIMHDSAASNGGIPNAVISNNELYDISNDGISISEGSGLIISNNFMYDVGRGINVENSNNGVVLNNWINYSGNGIYLGWSFTGLAKGNNITNSRLFNNYGVWIYAQQFVNFTENIINGSARSLMLLGNVSNYAIYHNNIINSTNYGVGGNVPIEVSYNGSGNFWGHATCPTFVAGTDSNDTNIVDSFAYNVTDGWNVYAAPPTCDWVNLLYFETEDENNNTVNFTQIGIGQGMTVPESVELYAMANGTRNLSINITHGGLCIGMPDPSPMSFSFADNEFIFNCTVNKTMLNENNTWYLNATAYLDARQTITDIGNFSIYSDFTRPNIIFDWKTMRDHQGQLVKLPKPQDLLGNPDNFFSPVDNNVTILVNATDSNNISYVEAEFNITNLPASTCTGTMNLTFNPASGLWELNCSFGAYNSSDLNPDDPGNFVQGTEVMIYAYDTYMNENNMYNNSVNSSCTTSTQCKCPSDWQSMPPECAPAFVPLLVHDIGAPEMNDPCVQFGPLTTDFNNEFNFSDINFIVEVQYNISCMEQDPTLYQNFFTVNMINFTSLDFENESTANKIGSLEENLNITIPSDWGDARIYVNSTYFSELNSQAQIKFYHLPFITEPTLRSDPTAAGVFGGKTWSSGFDNLLGEYTGNFTFNVRGFSGYNMTDNIVPTISHIKPVNGFNYSAVINGLNYTVNGTRTEPSEILVYLDGVQIANFTSNTTNCNYTDITKEAVSCLTPVNLTNNHYNVTIIAYDYGGAYPGNNATSSIRFTVDTIAPTTTDDAPNGWQTADFNITLNATDAMSGVAYTTYINNGANVVMAINGTNIPVMHDGNYTIIYYSVDNSRNREANNTINVLLDKVAPNSSDDAPIGWQNTPFNVTLSRTDNVSGILNTKYSLDGAALVTGTNVEIDSDGNHSITYFSTDVAGNVENNITVYAALDTTDPVVSSIAASAGNTTANITFLVNENSTCFVNFGTNTSYGSSTGPVLGDNHSFLLSMLTPGTQYHYSINCTDKAANSINTTDKTFITTNSQSATFNTSGSQTLVFNSTKNGNTTTDAELELKTTTNTTATLDLTVTEGNTEGSDLAIPDLDIYAKIDSGVPNSNISWVIIKLYYDESQLPARVKESSLKLYYYNTTSATWEVVTPGGVDTVNNYVWGNTTHFSTYAIGGRSTTSTSSTSSGGGGGGGGASYNVDMTSEMESKGFATKKIAKYNYVTYNFKGEKHKVKILQTDYIKNYVTFMVESTPRMYSLYEKQSITVDLDEDGVLDMIIYVEDVSAGWATLTFNPYKPTVQPISVPDMPIETQEVKEVEEPTVEKEAAKVEEKVQQVVEKVKDKAKQVEKGYSGESWYIGVIVAAVILVAIIGYLYWKKK